MYASEQKSVAVAYLLWFFLGGVGAHRFYLGKPGSAVVLFLITVFSPFTLFATLFVVAVWLLVDLFLIPAIVTTRNGSLGSAFSV